MVVKNCAVMFVLNVSAHCSGSLCMKCSEIAVAEVQSGVPALENRVLSSFAMPALLTSRWSSPDILPVWLGNKSMGLVTVSAIGNIPDV